MITGPGVAVCLDEVVEGGSVGAGAIVGYISSENIFDEKRNCVGCQNMRGVTYYKLLDYNNRKYRTALD